MHIDKFDNAIPTIEYFNNRNNTPNWKIEQQETDFIDLTYIIHGQATYTINKEKYHVRDGDLLCIPKGSHRYATSENPRAFECYAVNFALHDAHGEEMDVPLPICSNVGIYNDVITHFNRINENWLSRGSGCNMRIRAHFMLILQRFMAMLVYDADYYQFDPRVKQAIRFLTERFSDHLTISQVAEVVSLNPVYFGALFKKETHMTFRDYLTTIRLNQAEDMLQTGKWNVTEVAQNCGFTDVFYFSRLFKKHKGIPPSSVQA